MAEAITSDIAEANGTKQQLLQYIEKIERLENEKTAVSEEIKEVLALAKNDGYDLNALKKILKLRRMDSDDIAEQDAFLDLYRSILNI